MTDVQVFRGHDRFMVYQWTWYSFSRKSMEICLWLIQFFVISDIFLIWKAIQVFESVSYSQFFCLTKSELHILMLQFSHQLMRQKPHLFLFKVNFLLISSYLFWYCCNRKLGNFVEVSSFKYGVVTTTSWGFWMGGKYKTS